MTWKPEIGANRRLARVADLHRRDRLRRTRAPSRRPGTSRDLPRSHRLGISGALLRRASRTPRRPASSSMTPCASSSLSSRMWLARYSSSTTVGGLALVLGAKLLVGDLHLVTGRGEVGVRHRLRVLQLERRGDVGLLVELPLLGLLREDLQVDQLAEDALAIGRAAFLTRLSAPCASIWRTMFSSESAGTGRPLTRGQHPFGQRLVGGVGRVLCHGGQGGGGERERDARGERGGQGGATDAGAGSRRGRWRRAPRTGFVRSSDGIFRVAGRRGGADHAIRCTASA